MRYNLINKKTKTCVLTIAGSDCCGGAGLQADIKVINYYGLWAASIVTCVTAQNNEKFYELKSLSSKIITKQITAVCQYYQVKAVKIGMVYNQNIIRTIIKQIFHNKLTNIVLDPLLFSSTGKALIKKHAYYLLQKKLIPFCSLLTPNLIEAGYLLDNRLITLKNIKQVIIDIYHKFNVPVLLKGGHQTKNGVKSDTCIDLFYAGEKIEIFPSSRFNSRKILHGTGCLLSSAITANLALGKNLSNSIKLAKKFLTQQIKNENPIFFN